MQLEDWLDDLCVRFIINLPPEELSSVERICFQVEEAQWFYEDFIRPLDPALPSLPLRAFSLRIFQHCSLFSQWSAQHQTDAFAEFLAYKSRVPVRGAIMLNEAMDEVVLVKGWKKGANWSFPRGKINKDENDLDCAVREVYEETGFDIQAAGLVKDEKDMKFIEITMREQHMKLFVFRGVPKDTYFEPRTRKEISKIEWYKLTDLPTLKKHKHQDSIDGNSSAFNANKFYMVAPFLTPLKKWIAQQKKKENRYSSRLALPSTVAEESQGLTDVDSYAVHDVQHASSDLPEVSLPSRQDPSAHLKALLHVGEPLVLPSITPNIPGADTDKSNALLALLRGSSASLQPHTPMEQITSMPQIPQSPEHSHVQQSVALSSAPPPHYSGPRGVQEFHTQPPAPQPNIPHPPRTWAEAARGNNFQFPPQSPEQSRKPDIDTVFTVAPYQQTGDPQFSKPDSHTNQRSAVPPASALPTLTNHTKSLLDVLRSSGSNSAQPTLQQPTPVASQTTTQSQTLLSLFSQVLPPATQTQPPPLPSNNTITNRPAVSALQQHASVQQKQSPMAPPPLPRTEAQNALLGLFNPKPSFGQSNPMTTSSLQSNLDQLANTAAAMTAPVELAATTSRPTNQTVKDVTTDQNDLLSLLKTGSQNTAPNHQVETTSATQKNVRMAKEGETSATIDGPLNQPDFEAVSKLGKHGHAHAHDPTHLGRSPLTKNRTLFDPNQTTTATTPMKILSRPGSSGVTSARSPRAAKPNATGGTTPASSRRPHKETIKEKEPAKPFQPQILKRPNPSVGPSPTVQPIQQVEIPAAQEVSALSLIPRNDAIPFSPPGVAVPAAAPVSSIKTYSPMPMKRPSQAEGHKENLLALFGRPAAAQSPRVPTPKSDTANTSPYIVSPISTSQILNTGYNNDVPTPLMEPISTRSRVGSLASITSGVGGLSGLTSPQTAAEKRQTGAENKAFLLGYLGRIASQT